MAPMTRRKRARTARPESIFAFPLSNDGENKRAFDTSLKVSIQENGFVIVKQVLSPSEVTVAKQNVWDWIEGAYKGVREADPGTWAQGGGSVRTLFPSDGIVTRKGAGQCLGAWNIRTNPKVQRIFAGLWNEADLISSMDAMFLWRDAGCRGVPPHRDANEGASQAPEHVPGRPYTIQATVSLTAADARTGGFYVAPGTHRGFGGLGATSATDIDVGTCDILPLDPGDMVLWDSRLLHGARPGTPGDPPPTTPLGLLRIAIPVCMVPRSWAGGGDQGRWKAGRRKVVQHGWTTTHTPHCMEIKREGRWEEWDVYFADHLRDNNGSIKKEMDALL